MSTKKHPLQRMIENDCEIELSLREYSGRGMFGAKCLGIVGDLGTVVANLIATALYTEIDEKEEITNALGGISFDSMGRSDSIVYFPGVPYTPTETVYDNETFGMYSDGDD